MRSEQAPWVLLATFLGTLVILVMCPFVGPTSLSYGDVFANFPPSSGDRDAQIFFSVRLPRSLLAALTGCAMACAGVVFQAVLRNPLACPFTLGVAGGSSFGAVVAILFSFSGAAFGLSLVTFGAFLGALLSLFLLFSLASLLRAFSALTLLLAGVAVNYFFNALVLLSYYVADFTQAYAMIHWMIGSLDVVDWGSVGGVALVTGLGVAVLYAFSRELNLLSAGEDLARTKGVPARKVAWGALFAASLMTSACVALTGPIAFVGLIVPHIFRLWIGNDHRYLLPVSALGGGGFLMLCDTAARTFFGPTELPVGVLTAILGVPVLLGLLFRRKALEAG